MKTRQKNNSGIVLVTVVCFSAVLAILIVGLMSESMLQIKVARRQSGMEQAFYVAEGGAERAVSYIRAGGAVPGTITGTIGNGSYITTILAVESLGNNCAITGAININPNNSPDNEFLLVETDGTIITRDDLHQDTSDRSGTAILVHVKPKGPGSQNSLVIDGVAYALQNNTAYTISSAGMTFSLYNNNRNPQGKAVGQWWITLNGPGALSDSSSGTIGSAIQYSIFSLGVSGGSKRIVILEGIYQKSWAKYALWYNADAYGCWFKGGEKFYGPVHANVLVNFSGDPEFFELLSTAQSTYGGSTNAVTFHQGFEMNAPAGSMASINFTELRSDAALVFTGETSIAFSGTNLLVSNSRRGWSNQSIPLPENSLVYVADASSGTAAEGTAKVGGTLDGRLTIATDYDILITNNITYSVNPTNNSDDALGLIAGRNVRLETNCPNNLTIYAHILATGNKTASTTDGMFYVNRYNYAPYRGTLTVYGGIVQNTRGPVGTFSTWTGQMYSGFEKEYTFDPRFSSSPPPNYPVITNEYDWTSWRDMAP